MTNTILRGVRGATTLDNNTKENIESATVELLNEMMTQNNITPDMIACAFFSTTHDINADFPAKYARLHCGFKYVPMMNYDEMDVQGALKMCLRILLNINTNKTQQEIKHIYLRGAKTLREDLGK